MLFIKKLCCGVMLMSDKVTPVKELRDLVNAFVEERNWRQFHTPKSLSMSVAIEAAELMELFQWSDPEILGENHLTRVREELADVIIYCLAMANVLEIDITRALREKVAANVSKYPVEKYKGRYI